jgi:formate C-acetyltransferase
VAISLIVEDCIGNATDFGFLRGSGAVYTVDAPHAGGIVDAANALQAINWVVWEQKKMSLNEFIDIVKHDWEGHEDLRQELRTKLTYYGNGDKQGDAMMQRLYDAFVDRICYRKFYNGILFPAGISTFGRQVTDEFLDNRTANPDGHKKGEYLSNNITPTPGTDLRGATAVLRSYGGLDMRKLPGGTALEIKMSNATVRGEDGIEGLMDLMYAFCDLGCHFMQLDVVDKEMLLRAQQDPDNYGDLVVRVSGWSSRFRTLEKQWQQLVIERTDIGF